ncbi:MAG: hypothetical protein WA997_11430 [Anaerolineales bacterium]
MSTAVRIDKPAPNFKLVTFEGDVVKLSDFQDRKNVLLVFNRGFT